MTDRCYFVTGASGFVGRHLCQRLRAAGHRVRGLVRGKNSELEDLGVEAVRGDLADCAVWQSKLAGVDYVIHCAANASFGGGASYATVNVDGTRNLLAAIRDAAPTLRRFVLVSTIGAVDRAPGDSCRRPMDGNSPLVPTSDYGRSKRDAERIVRESGLPFAIVRPALVVGRDMRVESHMAHFVRSAIRRAPLARIAWTGSFGVIHVDDLAAALETCATHPDAEGKIFHCAGSPLALRDCFAAAQPGAWRIPVGWAAGIARMLPVLFPFKLKAMLLPAYTASDAGLEILGWRARRSGIPALHEVITRERARHDPELDPGGQTVITGAASGLGEAIVERIGARRRNLLLIDRDGAGLQRVRDKHPHCRIQVVDLADERAIAQLVASDDWRAHRIVELFACAGFGLRGPMLDSDADQHTRLFKVNVLARLALAHAALPDMIAGHLGRIVFISSSSAFQPLPYMASYAASNAALLLLGEAWASELADTGVHMMQVCPGGMQTNFQRHAGVKTLAGERLMPPEQVANAIMRALAKRKLTAIVSARSLAMSLLARLLPRAASVALWKKLMTRLR
ncbi:MAG: SDR family NAD(P)-dependent oxidoreductase [Opitutaceae bacterium]